MITLHGEETQPTPDVGVHSGLASISGPARRVWERRDRAGLEINCLPLSLSQIPINIKSSSPSIY